MLDFFSAETLVGSVAYRGEVGNMLSTGLCCGDARARKFGVIQLKSP